MYGLESKNVTLMIAHTNSPEAAEALKKDVEEAIPGISIDMVDPLSLSVSCHIGPGALAVACTQNLSVE